MFSPALCKQTLTGGNYGDCRLGDLFVLVFLSLSVLTNFKAKRSEVTSVSSDGSWHYEVLCNILLSFFLLILFHLGLLAFALGCV